MKLAAENVSAEAGLSLHYSVYLPYPFVHLTAFQDEQYQSRASLAGLASQFEYLPMPAIFKLMSLLVFHGYLVFDGWQRKATPTAFYSFTAQI